MERDSPQDGVWLQPDRPRLPGPQLPGQCLDGTVGPGCQRGQPQRLTSAGPRERHPPRPALPPAPAASLPAGPTRASHAWRGRRKWTGPADQRSISAHPRC